MAKIKKEFFRRRACMTALCVVLGVILFISCGTEDQTEETAAEEEDIRDKITIMHVDAEYPEFQEFIAEAEEILDMEIEVIPCPENADIRQAKISTMLAAGETSVDIFSVNDEMISEFKHKGYLEPLSEDVMTEEIRALYPENYMENIVMSDGKIYSVPYYMDIMVYWVNRSMTGDMETETKEDFIRLLETEFEDGKYGYGGAWDSTYVYNELYLFINLFGGSYYDWQNEKTKEALSFFYDMAKNQQTPTDQVTDQYEQLVQKFMDGTYASIFVYSGEMNTFVRKGVYREDYIQLAALPEFESNTTNVAAWQYVLNKSSVRKGAALRFLQYAASREGSIAYSEYMNRFPARLDIIMGENLNITGIEVFREYVENTELKERPFSRNPMEEITSIGTLFQAYVLGEIDQEQFCSRAQEITDNIQQ